MSIGRQKVQELYTAQYEIVYSCFIIQTVMKRKTAARRIGRPRSFDANQALDRALEVFRRKGYEGASLNDLTHAMGIERPSLYAAFGDKENLFRQALDRYSEQALGYINEALSEKRARTAIERLLRGTAALQTDPRGPKGCLTVQGALACKKESAPIREELICRREQGEAVIRQRLQRAKRERDLPADSNPADLARYFATVLQGMSVQAASGVNRRELERVVDAALKAWPE